MSTRLRHMRRDLTLGWRRWRYTRQFDQCGSGFYPAGALTIVNEGSITVGTGFRVEGFAYQPIELIVSSGAHLQIGNDVFMNQGTHISCSVGISIGDHVLFAKDAFIIDNDWHGVGDRPVRKEPIRIESNVWVSTRAVILRGVTLGEGCIVAAGAVVTRSIPPNTLAGGVPARPIREVRPHDRA